MDIEAKRDELSQWINNLNEDMLQRIDELKKSLSNEIVIYTSNGKGLTKKEYKNHLDTISKNIETGQKTYTSRDVKTSIINRK